MKQEQLLPNKNKKHLPKVEVISDIITLYCVFCHIYIYTYMYLLIFFPSFLYQFWLGELAASSGSPVPPCVQMRKGRHFNYN